MNEDPAMKVSFTVEITGCSIIHKRVSKNCPFLLKIYENHCGKAKNDSMKTAQENLTKLTKTCPMVRAQFEALE